MVGGGMPLNPSSISGFICTHLQGKSLSVIPLVNGLRLEPIENQASCVEKEFRSPPVGEQGYQRFLLSMPGVGQIALHIHLLSNFYLPIF